jgi:hypothetical protein
MHKVCWGIGLKDINEREIYADSSIVKFTYVDAVDGSYDMIGVFTYNDIELRYEIDIYNQLKFTCLSYISNGKFGPFEIIGTMQEKPELLKG